MPFLRLHYCRANARNGITQIVDFLALLSLALLKIRNFSFEGDESVQRNFIAMLCRFR
jgi:hypothetical protein